MEDGGLTSSFSILHPQSSLVLSTFREVVWAKNKSLDPLAPGNGLHDLRQVRQSNVTVKEMIGLDQNADAARALVQATRRAGARLHLR